MSDRQTLDTNLAEKESSDEEPNSGTHKTGSENKEQDASSKGASGAFLRGSVQRITFRSHDSGFAVLRVEEEGSLSNNLTTVIGTIANTVSEGSTLVCRGVWQTHEKFGKQFKAYSISESKPTTIESITKYLASGVIKGIGPKLAERITLHFGECTLDVLEKEPDRLSEVSGLGLSKIEEIKATWNQKQEEREVLVFFQNHGISFSIARRVYAAYGIRAIENVKNNPYMLCRNIWGIGFLTADKIALSLGLAAHSQERLIAGISYALDEAQSDGHTYLPKDRLIKKSKSLLNIPDEKELSTALQSCLLQGLVIEYEDCFYPPLLFTLERKAAECILNRIQDINTVQPIPEWIINEAVQTRKALPNTQIPIALSDEQKEAVRLSAKSSIVVITGGPGCGKTTVVRSITSLFKKAGLQIKLAAPTGRAAQRLQEVCEVEASTIHRLLKYDPMKRSFVHDESDTLPLDALIVDESSMIDIPLAAALLRALSKKTRLIFVGDKDQLPSVGPGLFFNELLQLSVIPQARLTTLFRRDEESSINEIAHSINQGEVPYIPEPDGSGPKDAYFLPAQSAEEAAELVERLVCSQIPKKFNVKSEDIVVLTPMNQGELGIVALNQRLQKQLIPSNERSPKVQVGSLEFRMGDRVCQRVNNYQLHDAGVFNGEQGRIIGIDTTEKKLIVRLWDGREITYDSESLSQLDLAYSLTIHRSQGSEVPVVVLVLHDSHAIMLERQLLYTAVTRAKKLLLVVGTKSALKRAVSTTKSSKRFTGFGGMVKNHL